MGTYLRSNPILRSSFGYIRCIHTPYLRDIIVIALKIHRIPSYRYNLQQGNNSSQELEVCGHRFGKALLDCLDQRRVLKRRSHSFLIVQLLVH